MEKQQETSTMHKLLLNAANVAIKKISSPKNKKFHRWQKIVEQVRIHELINAQLVSFYWRNLRADDWFNLFANELELLDYFGEIDELVKVITNLIKKGAELVQAAIYFNNQPQAKLFTSRLTEAMDLLLQNKYVHGSSWVEDLAYSIKLKKLRQRLERKN